MGTWYMIIQTYSNVTQGKGNQGIITQGKFTHSNNIHTITQGNHKEFDLFVWSFY